MAKRIPVKRNHYTHSNKFDVIVEFFIKEGIYDVHKINEVLFAYDQVLLGG